MAEQSICMGEIGGGNARDENGRGIVETAPAMQAKGEDEAGEMPLKWEGFWGSLEWYRKGGDVLSAVRADILEAVQEMGAGEEFQAAVSQRIYQMTEDGAVFSGELADSWVGLRFLLATENPLFSCGSDNYAGLVSGGMRLLVMSPRAKPLFKISDGRGREIHVLHCRGGWRGFHPAGVGGLEGFSVVHTLNGVAHDPPGGEPALREYQEVNMLGGNHVAITCNAHFTNGRLWDPDGENGAVQWFNTLDGFGEIAHYVDGCRRRRGRDRRASGYTYAFPQSPQPEDWEKDWRPFFLTYTDKLGDFIATVDVERNRRTTVITPTEGEGL